MLKLEMEYYDWLPADLPGLMVELDLGLEASLRPEAASWGLGQLPRRLQVVAPFLLSPIRNMGGSVSEDKIRLNRISCLYCSR